MLRKSIVFGVSAMLAAGLAATPASASTAKAATKAHVASAVHTVIKPKAGGTCTKSYAVTKIGSATYLCTKNSKRKYVWTKLSSDCLNLYNAYLKMNSDYTSALKQITDMQAKIANQPGAAFDALRTQVSGLKSTVTVLGPTVSDALGQFRTLCG